MSPIYIFFQESTWDIGNEERTASGIEPAGDVETWGACENDEEDTSFQWKEEASAPPFIYIYIYTVYILHVCTTGIISLYL